MRSNRDTCTGKGAARFIALMNCDDCDCCAGGGGRLGYMCYIFNRPIYSTITTAGKLCEAHNDDTATMRITTTLDV